MADQCPGSTGGDAFVWQNVALVLSDFGENCFDPRLIEANTTNHIGAIGTGQRNALAAVQRDPDLGFRGIERLVPLIDGTDDAEAVAGDGQIRKRLRVTES